MDIAPFEKRLNASLRERFRGEFLSRVDEILLFHSLGAEDLLKIARRILGEIEERAKGLGLSVSFDPSVARFLCRSGEASAGGARPLRRSAVQLVEDPLSLALLEGRFRRGDTLQATVSEGEDSVRFEKCG